MTINQPVSNLNAPVIDTKTGQLLSPWNMFFQQFTQNAQPIVTLTTSELAQGYTPNAIGFVQPGENFLQAIITRGDDSITLNTYTAFIPVSVGDTIKVFNPAGFCYFIPQR